MYIARLLTTIMPPKSTAGGILLTLLGFVVLLYSMTVEWAESPPFIYLAIFSYVPFTLALLLIGFGILLGNGSLRTLTVIIVVSMALGAGVVLGVYGYNNYGSQPCSGWLACPSNIVYAGSLIFHNDTSGTLLQAACTSIKPAENWIEFADPGSAKGQLMSLFLSTATSGWFSAKANGECSFGALKDLFLSVSLSGTISLNVSESSSGYALLSNWQQVPFSGQFS